MQGYFSDIFNVDEEILDNYGAFNISLINDIPLFVDPFLLFYSEKDEYKKLHSDIIRYLVFLKNKSLMRLNETQLKAWYMFPEQKQNWLGYSISGNSGSGLGKDFANNLRYVLKEKFNDFGKETISKGSHLEKLCLINDGVGKDNISDFTVNLIKSFLLKYTEKFARLYIDENKCKNFWIQKDSFNYEKEIWERKQYYLPCFNNDYVILTPKDILTRECSWINKDDLYKHFENLPFSIENDVLRMQINQHFEAELMRVNKERKPTKEEKNKAIHNTIREYPEILDYYIKQKELDGNDAIKISEKRVDNTQNILIKNTRDFINYLNENTKFYEGNKETAYEEALERVNYLKHCIENNDCYKLFYDGDKAIEREKDLQLMFRLVCYGCEYDVNSEVNNGRGPVDYKISKGAYDSSLVEFKLAKNSKLKPNLMKQVEIYKQANKTQLGLKVIIYFTETEYENLISILNELNLADDPNIILIDARKDNKISASNVK